MIPTLTLHKLNQKHIVAGCWSVAFLQNHLIVKEHNDINITEYNDNYSSKSRLHAAFNWCIVIFRNVKWLVMIKDCKGFQFLFFAYFQVRMGNQLVFLKIYITKNSRNKMERKTTINVNWYKDARAKSRIAPWSTLLRPTFQLHSNQSIDLQVEKTSVWKFGLQNKKIWTHVTSALWIFY